MSRMLLLNVLIEPAPELQGRVGSDCAEGNYTVYLDVLKLYLVSSTSGIYMLISGLTVPSKQSFLLAQFGHQ